MSRLKFSSLVKFEIETFDGKLNFGLWQIEVKDMLIQSGLHKALKRKPSPASKSGSGKASISNEDWEKLNDRAAIAIRLCLAMNVLANVGNIPIVKDLWESVLNGIVLELEVIGVKIEDEDKALRLLWSLPTSYKHLLPTLIYGKKTVDLEEVTSTLLSEERRLSGESTETAYVLALVKTLRMVWRLIGFQSNLQVGELLKIGFDHECNPTGILEST
ncbi:hypothetical protein KPL70_017352 [Citrus sinensis]|nr:hypothetical protein KPL70_017352 [Citrus sinensis]